MYESALWRENPFLTTTTATQLAGGSRRGGIWRYRDKGITEMD